MYLASSRMSLKDVVISYVLYILLLQLNVNTAVPFTFFFTLNCKGTSFIPPKDIVAGTLFLSNSIEIAPATTLKNT